MWQMLLQTGTVVPFKEFKTGPKQDMRVKEEWQNMDPKDATE